MKSAYVRAGSKAGILVAYLYQADVGSIGSRAAAELMGCESKAIPSLVGGLVRKGVMLRTCYPDGMHYSLAPGVSLEFEQDGRYRCDYLTAEEVQSGCIDEVDDPTAIKRVWVAAAGQPLPQTSAVRSVFELGQAMGAM